MIASWDEETYSKSDDGAKQSHAKIKQTYSGGIAGKSEVHYLMSYRSDGTAIFVGFEKITGTVNGKSGSLVLQHNGTFESGVAKSNFVIVSGSGHGDLNSLAGRGEFTSTEHGKAGYKFVLEA